MEVTRENFKEHINNIEDDIQRSSFIGFDAEFTAILSGEAFKHRLFDTNEERYNKIKHVAGNMIMTQVGLTIFRYDRDRDMYMATGYTFHLCPQVFGNIDQAFVFQASTLQFLCKHKFDFNKFIYKGLPYLSKHEEDLLRQQIADDTLFSNLLSSLSMEDERYLQRHCSEISKWLTQSVEGTMYIDIQDPIMRYLLHKEARIRFPTVLTTNSLGNSYKLLIYRDNTIDGATSLSEEVLQDILLQHVLGFSKIISLLKTYKKPLIGHNIFLDLLLLHSQFIGPLPNKYTCFKKNLHKVFPNVYDTKHISFEMAKKLSFGEVWKSNALQDLYEFFSEGKCKKLNIGLNQIRLTSPFSVNQSYHEAGWDSYCSGYCFIRMGHWAACELSGTYRPVGPAEKLSALDVYKNKVNIIRGAVKYMCLDGKDPPKSRPDLLHIFSKYERVINIGKIATLLGSHGSIDVKPHGRKTALIAASSQFTVDKILKQFKYNKDYRVSIFSVYKHTTIGRVAVWSSAILTGSLIFYYLHNKMKGLSP